MRDHDVSDRADDSGSGWRRSSRSYGAGECVEVAVRDGKRMDVRDSKNPQGAVLRVTGAEWMAFIRDVRSGMPRI